MILWAPPDEGGTRPTGATRPVGARRPARVEGEARRAPEPARQEGVPGPGGGMSRGAAQSLVAQVEAEDGRFRARR